MEKNAFGIDLPSRYKIKPTEKTMDQEVREIFGDRSVVVGMAYTECLNI